MSSDKNPEHSSGYFEYQRDPVSGEYVKVPANPEDVKKIEEYVNNDSDLDAELSVLAGVPLEQLDVPLAPKKKKRRNRKHKRPAQTIITDESTLVEVEQTLHDKLCVDLKEMRVKAAQRIGNPGLTTIDGAELKRRIAARAKEKRENAKKAKARQNKLSASFSLDSRMGAEKNRKFNARCNRELALNFLDKFNGRLSPAAEKLEDEKLETVPLCTRLENEFIANNPDPSTWAEARKKEEDELEECFARTATRLAKRMEELNRMAENDEEEDDYYG